ncbi:Hypothetical predicted protein [Cloeon dipterum]|uniref:Uncharacterized protein n=1 Tax=Cloeon dipterum TaxID=197152 RepID=A0A8S1D2L2_9INSE|nr:Hypothetical predicted protein [Cloeon dipterum]
MDPAVKNFLMAICGESSSVDISEAFGKFEEMSFGDFMQCIRTMVAPMGSEKTLKVLSSLLNKKFIGLFAGMNFEEFAKLFPSEKDFLLKVLRLYTSPKHAKSILYLNLFVIEKYGSSATPPRMDQELCTEFIKMKNLNSIYIDKYYFTLQELIEMSRNLPALKKIKVLIDSESWLPLEVPDFAQIFRNRFSNLEEFIYLTRDSDDVNNQRKLEFFACEEMEHTSLMERLELLPKNLNRVASNAEKFPHVSSLTLDWDNFEITDLRNKEKWNSLKSLKKLTKMTHLNNFKLNSSEENLDMIENSVDDSYSLRSFQSLLDLQITFSYFNTKEVKISNLLAAPNLKIAKLIGFRVSKDELKRTILLIKTKTILTKVETLSLTLDGRINADLKTWMENEFGYLINALRNERQAFQISMRNVSRILGIRNRPGRRVSPNRWNKYRGIISQIEQRQSPVVHIDTSNYQKYFEDLDQYYDYLKSNEIPFEDFIQYLRTLATQVTSSNVLDLLSSFLDTPFVGFFTGMNLQEFSNLYPTEPKFLLKVLSLITSSKHAENIFDLIITTTDELNGGTSQLKMETEDSGNFLRHFGFLRKFTNFCIKHLPKAREVRCEDIIFDMTEACEEMERTSRMEQLQLHPINLNRVASNADKFPHVLSLTLDWDRREQGFAVPPNKEKWELLKKWTKLIHLKNHDLSSEEYFELILSTFGANLNILYFGCSFGNPLDIDFKLIQENCPKLENLQLVNTGVYDGYSLGTFDSLLDLKITFQSDVRKEVKLTNLLAAPNLQIVELSGFRHQRPVVHIATSNYRKMDPLEELLKAMCKNCPDFEDLDQYYDYLASNEIPFEDFIQYLRTLATQVTSSNVLDILSSFLDTPFVGFFAGMNLQEFSNLYPTEPKFLLKVLSLITSPKHAENIFDLIITATDELNCGTSLPKMDWEMRSEFTKMTNLNSINIDKYYFTLEDLMAMCKNLPALRLIKVVIAAMSRLAIENPNFAQIFNDRFSNLEEFVYSLTVTADGGNFLRDFAFFRKFTNFCIKHLPKAREVRCEDIIFDMTEACEEMDRTSLIEYLELYPYNLDRVASNAQKFPHVLSLTLDWNRFEVPLIKERWGSLKKWNLIRLKNHDLCSEEYFELILSTFGANLNILYFGCSFGNPLDIDFKLIQENCPKLENLQLVNTGVNDGYSLGTFDSLLDLKITFQSDVRKEVKLTNLLAAPNLQIVELSGFRVSLFEMKWTILLIKTKSILKKVESLSLTLDGSIDARLKNSIKLEFEYFKNAMLSLRDDGDEAIVKLDFN